ncbi:hypothetical protein KP509_28G065500 [Ceratopteris richardii]|uniref:Secreted protein n=1 Tax=Ceratopteris richardii TaxID=49495 RepID=A0A8T2RFH4_CERRI|nr:hypothetical protein KP509_28G065500 [Ceratopteris richardii]
MIALLAIGLNVIISGSVSGRTYRFSSFSATPATSDGRCCCCIYLEKLRRTECDGRTKSILRHTREFLHPNVGERRCIVRGVHIICCEFLSFFILSIQKKGMTKCFLQIKSPDKYVV